MKILNFFLHPSPTVTVISISISLVLLFIVFPLVNNAYKKKRLAENERITREMEKQKNDNTTDK